MIIEHPGRIELTFANLRAAGPGSCERLQPDVLGSCRFPYIQSASDLEINYDWQGTPDAVERIELQLCAAAESDTAGIQRGERTVVLADPAPGDYQLQARPAGDPAWRTILRDIGIGTVIAALGDSLTEGYHGNAFLRDNLELTAASFPDSAVSRDRRNFPTFSPTAAAHKPEINCQQSWMPRLNDLLSDAWQHPVYISNEGWGGYTAGMYLQMMQDNQAAWQSRMQRLRPDLWLLHLGVNDERHFLPANEFADDLEAILAILMNGFGAAPESIYVARPSYDYAPNAVEYLRRYIAVIDRLIEDYGLRAGPDFFAAFATDKEKWYGADPVHPGHPGIEYMADLWRQALCKKDS